MLSVQVTNFISRLVVGAEAGHLGVARGLEAARSRGGQINDGIEKDAGEANHTCMERTCWLWSSLGTQSYAEQMDAHATTGFPQTNAKYGTLCTKHVLRTQWRERLVLALTPLETKVGQGKGSCWH